MTAITPGLAGHKGLRGDILLELKRAQPLTVKELADGFGVSANAVRRHLKELEAESLIVYSREQRGTGAPTYTNRLSPRGEALFPTQYGETLTDVLALVAQSGGREAVKELFTQRFQAHAERLRAELAEATLEEKVAAVVALLSQQGFMAAWSVGPDQVTLAEHNCAVRTVAEQFPEICAAEAEFLRDVLQRDLRRDSYIPDGCNACQYSITLSEGAKRAGGGNGRGVPREEES
ncbi:MAG: helix-turn-helix domain-containing protein [Gemmatimonadales bacterium]|jgi:DeoR family suf operon transcriptional repressor